MLRANLKKDTLLACLCWHCLVLTAQQPFQCNGDFYLSTHRRGLNWGAIDQFRPDSLLPFNPVYTRLYFDDQIRINTLGYSVADNYIYGLDPFTVHLYRVDANGEATDLGIPPGLDTAFYYFAGTVSPFGNNMVLIGRDKTNEIDRIYCNVSLVNGNYSASSLGIVSDVPTRIDDIAFDPVFGSLLGYDSRNKHVVTVTTSGLVTSVGFQTLSGIAAMGAVFFDPYGNLYAYGSGGGAETTLYLLDKRNGTIVSQEGPGPAGNFTDGCSCAFRLQFEKTVVPMNVLPCGEVTFTYRIQNTAGSSYSQIDLIDTLPEGFTITALNGVPAISQILSGVGSRVLSIRDLHVLLGENVITVRARVGNLPSGTYYSQAVFGPFPAAYPAPFLSDYPIDGGKFDPTPVTVLERDDILYDSTLVLCTGTSLTLDASVGATTYLWSDGSTNSTLTVQTPGLYWVEAMNDCVTYRDTLWVEAQAMPLTVDLGEAVHVRLGDVFSPDYITNATGVATFEWSATPETAALNCLNCAHPSGTPLENTLYHLLLTDEHGCQASDSLLVTVIPELNLYAPNAFSPNADGINDVFFIQGKVEAPIHYLRVFDRWGALVFECRDGVVNDTACGWNGKFKDKAAASDLYVYVAEIALSGGFNQLISGSISLLR